MISKVKLIWKKHISTCWTISSRHSVSKKKLQILKHRLLLQKKRRNNCWVVATQLQLQLQLHLIPLALMLRLELGIDVFPIMRPFVTGQTIQMLVLPFKRWDNNWIKIQLVFHGITMPIMAFKETSNVQEIHTAVDTNQDQARIDVEQFQMEPTHQRSFAIGTSCHAQFQDQMSLFQKDAQNIDMFF